MQDVYWDAYCSCPGGFLGHQQTVTHGFSHADDAAGAYFHAYFACQGDGAEFVGMCVCRAEFWEKFRGGFQVAVVAAHSGILQSLQGFAVKQSHRCA